MTIDLKQIFVEQFGREPDEKELEMLQNGSISRELFCEWLDRKLNEHLTKSQVKEFIKNFRTKNGSHWSTYDIFLRESRGITFEELEKGTNAQAIIKEGKKAVGSTLTGNAFTPVEQIARISGKHQGAGRRLTEDSAMRRLITTETLKEAKAAFKK